MIKLYVDATKSQIECIASHRETQRWYAQSSPV